MKPVETDVLMLLDHPFQADQRVEKECQLLQLAGLSVHVICFSETNLPQHDSLANGTPLTRIKTNFFRHPLRSDFRAQVKAVLQQLASVRFRILHVHDFYLAEFALALIKERPGTHLTYDSHEYFRGWRVYTDIQGFANKIKGVLTYRSLLRSEKKLLQRAHLVVTTTSAIQNMLTNEHHLQVPVVPVGNVPLKATIAAAQHLNLDLKSTLDIPAASTVIIQSGNIYQTEPEFEREANDIANTDDCYLVVIGSHKKFWEFKAKYERDWPFSNRIRFFEYDEAQHIGWLRSGDIGLVHVNSQWVSHQITSPNRTYEFIAAGLPLLSNEQVESRKFEQSHDCVTFFQETENGGFASALKSQIEHHKELSERAREAGRGLSFELAYQPVIEHYQNVLSDANA